MQILRAVVEIGFDFIQHDVVPALGQRMPYTKHLKIV